MGSSEKLCLKWDDFHTNISSSFANFRKGEGFSDVTLASDGDQRIESHKVILAASSSIFSKLPKAKQAPPPSSIYERNVH